MLNFVRLSSLKLGLTQQEEIEAVYTHELKKSGQKCFRAVWWPSKDPEIGKREAIWPMMMLESGQVTRVNVNNLKPITK